MVKASLHAGRVISLRKLGSTAAVIALRREHDRGQGVCSCGCSPAVGIYLRVPSAREAEGGTLSRMAWSRALHGEVGCGEGEDVFGTQTGGDMSARCAKSRMVVAWSCAPAASKGTVRDYAAGHMITCTLLREA